MEYYENAGNASAALFWSSPGQPRELVPAGLHALTNSVVGRHVFYNESWFDTPTAENPISTTTI